MALPISFVAFSVLQHLLRIDLSISLPLILRQLSVIWGKRCTIRKKERIFSASKHDRLPSLLLALLWEDPATTELKENTGLWFGHINSDVFAIATRKPGMGYRTTFLSFLFETVGCWLATHSQSFATLVDSPG